MKSGLRITDSQLHNPAEQPSAAPLELGHLMIGEGSF
jgi:hypothetical protein